MIAKAPKPSICSSLPSAGELQEGDLDGGEEPPEPASLAAEEPSEPASLGGEEPSEPASLGGAKAVKASSRSTSIGLARRLRLGKANRKPWTHGAFEPKWLREERICWKGAARHIMLWHG